MARVIKNKVATLFGSMLSKLYFIVFLLFISSFIAGLWKKYNKY